MRLANIIRAVRFEPWAITPAGHATLSAIVQRAAAGGLRADDNLLSQLIVTRPAMTIDENGTATIQIFGTLLSKSTAIEQTCGNTDYMQIRQEIGMAKAQGAERIVFAVDSPGGMVAGVRETAQAIRSADMPTMAMVDGDACSAAYWLASQTDRIEATPSSVIGSIGVIMPWIDQDGAWEAMGMEWNPITNDGATLKGAGGGPSLTPEQRQFLTDSANATAADFWREITDVRGMLPEELKRAGFYEASRAIEMGLIDAVI